MLTDDERERVETRPTANVDAYNLYLLGRHQLNRRSDDGLRRAIDFFDRAVAADPDYASPHAGLADAYNLAGAGYSAIPPKDARARAKAAAERALHLDSALAEAHTSFGFVNLHYEWNWPAAEAAFLTAIQLNRSHAPAFQWRAHLLSVRGCYQEALEMFGHARELDPLSVVIATEAGWPYLYMGVYDRALATFQRALELQPDFALAHYNIAICFERKRRYDEALEEYRNAVALSGGAFFMVAFLGAAYARCGLQAEATRILDDLLATSRTTYGVALSVAVVLDALGERERALDWIERAFHDREPFIIGLLTEEWMPFPGIRDSRRFRAIVDALRPT